MEYHLRVLQPFARDPAYYASIISDESDTPSKEGPVIHGAIKLYDYPIWPRTVLDSVAPLSAPQAADLSSKLRTIPGLLQAARANLSAANAQGPVGWRRPRLRRTERRRWPQLALACRRLASPGSAKPLPPPAARPTAFASWLRAEAPKKTGPSGIGKEQYTWYLRNVLLVPLSWEEEVTITKRELARAHASLRLEENRNRRLPPLADGRYAGGL